MQADLLKDHFNQLEAEIAKLRQQQKAIIGLLEEPISVESQMVTKARW
ncbi:hypothetical protein JCM19237_4093 [Photobacterium aphoticum]|uniref:Uncharacterized protein n=1 Tax=Photobacterium aphoticum TaxID=754436 RepID=A0A090RAW6_9GAMM|nr:hypothetical protein JCM19237_4093 [Photobacterium aphoticum]